MLYQAQQLAQASQAGGPDVPKLRCLLSFDRCATKSPSGGSGKRNIALRTIFLSMFIARTPLDYIFDHEEAIFRQGGNYRRSLKKLILRSSLERTQDETQ